VDIKQPDYQVSVKYNNGNAFEDAEVVTTTETLAIEKQVDNSTKVIFEINYKSRIKH